VSRSRGLVVSSIATAVVVVAVVVGLALRAAPGRPDRDRTPPGTAGDARTTYDRWTSAGLPDLGLTFQRRHDWHLYPRNARHPSSSRVGFLSSTPLSACHAPSGDVPCPGRTTRLAPGGLLVMFSTTLGAGPPAIPPASAERHIEVFGRPAFVLDRAAPTSCRRMGGVRQVVVEARIAEASPAYLEVNACLAPGARPDFRRLLHSLAVRVD
jgi:hypothetical protein